MSLKKLALVSALSVAAFGTTSVLADNANASSNMSALAGFYAEGAFGYAMRDWKYLDSTASSNKEGGLTALVDLGYQLNDSFSVEMGGVYLPVKKDASDDKSKAYSAYLAAKVQVPVDQVVVFGKAGAAYNRNKDEGTDTTSTFVSPMFALGMAYDVNDNVYVTSQYTYLTNNNAAEVPNAQLLTVGLGYKFAA